MTTTWNSEELDLDAYLARIGYDGDRTPTVPTLRALQRQHVLNVPFENVDIQLGRPILLDLPSLQRKMVDQHRGGYCFEHGALFAAALERLGFGVTAYAARVRFGQGDKVLPETHAVLRVSTAETADTGREWFSDVGFGYNAFEPAEFADGAEVTTGGWTFRLARLGGEPEEWVWRSPNRPEGTDLHSVVLNPQYPVDYEAKSHYVSTYPRSPFVTRIYAQRIGPGFLHIMDHLTHRTVYPDGTSEARQVEPGEVPKVLAESFHVELDAPDAERLVRRVSELGDR